MHSSTVTVSLLYTLTQVYTLKKITDEMAAITFRLCVILQKKILQPGEYAAKPDLSGDVMEKGRVKFVMLRLPMASLKEKLGLGYQATGHKRRNA
ncbi:hypothetical protein BKA60DRAFT_149884 [Fusarium oxysporum]|nr:hypothetical protein BKA60DRAFT_149884 [Fusarium oxysporum]